jgi:transposase
MGEKRRQFTREFKFEAVRLVAEDGRSVADVARELGIRADMLRAWRPPGRVWRPWW